MKTSYNVLALPVALTTTTLQARADEPTTGCKPFYAHFRVGSQSDFQVFINKFAPEALTITLKNGKGETLHTSEVGKREPGKAVNFSMRQQPDGVYTVEIRSKRETVTKTFIVATPSLERTLALKQ